MSERKLKICFYTIADFIEEEIWLREEHRKGWRLAKMIPPCFYYFEKCEPEDVIYKLDYENANEAADYMQLVHDYGWEYIGRCVGWLYFRKPASAVVDENDGELFSDNVSRGNMIQHILKTRMLPILIIFLCCVIPNVIRVLDGEDSIGFMVFWIIILILYLFLLVHCGLKLRKLKKDLY